MVAFSLAAGRRMTAQVIALPVPDIDAATKTKRERECRVGQAATCCAEDTAGRGQMHSLFGDGMSRIKRLANDQESLSRFRHNPAAFGLRCSHRKRLAIALQAA